jgi:histidinol-phosphatase (PHP family)
MLPADGHVHSEWSWDAVHGSMARTCAQAVEQGLPAVAFTEHADWTTFEVVTAGPAADDYLTGLAGSDGMLTPPPLDVAGYLDCLQRCREQFPDLRILSGTEVGEPHWHGPEVAGLLAAGQFDRVLGSLHCLRLNGRLADITLLFAAQPAGEVIRAYLAEIPRLVAGSDAFSVLAHLDYPLRVWPSSTAGPFRPQEFEAEFRSALRTLAGSGRALEINTRSPQHPEILGWWHEEGGPAVSFGSDAHEPARLAAWFAEAAAMAEAAGFRAGRDPWDFWPRTG